MPSLEVITPHSGGPRDDHRGGRLDRAFDRAAPVIATVSVLLIAVACVGLWALEVGVDALLVVIAASLGLAALFIGVEPRQVRRRAWLLLGACAGFELNLLLLLAWIQQAEGVVVVGPDAALFYQSATWLARNGLSTPVHPIDFFGTFDIGHYYLFAALLRTVDGGLLTLQLANTALVLLASLLTYLWMSRVAPRWALLAGVLTGTYLPVVSLAVMDLWKDPFVFWATSVVIWAMVHALEARSFRAAAGWGLLLGTGLALLRVTRFYTAGYLALAMIGLLALAAVRRRSPLVPRHVVAGLVLALLVAEATPRLIGWPSTPAMFVRSVTHTVETPTMANYGAGLLDSVAAIKQTLSAPAAASEAGRPAPKVSVTVQTRAVAFESLRAGSNLVRRLYGPFVWIPPPEWSAGEVLGGLYLHYPGMLVWYAVLPLAFVGAVIVAFRTARLNLHPALLVLVGFAALYGAQYLTINLAVRQRDVMFTVMLALAVVGFETYRSSRSARRLYLVYWLGLGLLAAAHLLVRYGLYLDVA